MLQQFDTRSNANQSFLGNDPWWKRAGKLRGEANSHEVTRRDPCPVCGKGTWCLHGFGIAICHRIEDGSVKTWNMAGGPGHIHDLEATPGYVRPTRPPRKTAKPKLPKDWATIAKRAYDAARRPGCTKLDELAEAWGVGRWVLDTMEIGWDGSTWTVPERDAAGEIIGISRRKPNGKKFMYAGSSRGLYFTAGWANGEGPIQVVEGASDVATMLQLGMAVVGRSAASPGPAELDELAKLLETLPHDREIVIIGENDQKPDGRWPGRDGANHTARELAKRLGRPVGWCLTQDGAKDFRSWVAAQTENPAMVKLSWTVSALRISESEDAAVRGQARHNKPQAQFGHLSGCWKTAIDTKS